jgi:holliday junction DNA helicase RuvA
MIDSLRGHLISRGDETVLQVGPVCFELLLSERSRQHLVELPGEVEVFVSLQVRDDRLELVAFARPEERELYRSLRRISGVGTRLALAVLSTLSLGDLASAVATGDVKPLMAVPGVGKKTASRLLLELKDRLATLVPAGDFELSSDKIVTDPHREQVLAVLESLGMGPSEATRILEGLPAESGIEVEDLIRLALAASAKS